MNVIDCHTHTKFSVDSDADIISCIRSAYEKNLRAYAITDHCECNWWFPREHYPDTELSEDFDFGDCFEKSVSAVTKLKEQYGEKLNILCGVEMGQPLHAPEIAEKIVTDKRLDMVIASVHQIRDEKDFYFINYRTMTADEIDSLLEKYFTEIYEVCKWGKFDVLGHLGYPVRYISASGISVNIDKFDDIIFESFRKLAQNGRGIEINSSGIRQGVGHCFPSEKYVKMFRDIGGEIVSVGSDAHIPNDIGRDVDIAIKSAYSAGFEKLCFFRDRKPVFLNIN